MWCYTSVFIIIILLEVLSNLLVSFRRHLGQLIYDLLVDDQVSHTLIQPLVTLYRELYLAEMAFIDQLVTVISDVRLPMSTEVKQLSQDKQRKIDIKASIRECSLTRGPRLHFQPGCVRSL